MITSDFKDVARCIFWYIRMYKMYVSITDEACESLFLKYVAIGFILLFEFKLITE